MVRKEPVYDEIDDASAPVIICGFGRFGQIVGRVLNMQRIAFTALDKDPAQVEVVRRFGNKVYFGNPAREEVLRAAGAETARVLVVALDEMDETLLVAEMAKRHFPQLAIYARARNRRHAHRLMDLDIAGIIRETLYSSLRLTEMVLEKLGVEPELAHRAIELFEQHDERSLQETHAIAYDEQQLSRVRSRRRRSCRRCSRATWRSGSRRWRRRSEAGGLGRCRAGAAGAGGAAVPRLRGPAAGAAAGAAGVRDRAVADRRAGAGDEGA